MLNWFLAFFIGKSTEVTQPDFPVLSKDQQLKNYTLPKLQEDEGNRIRKGRHYPYKDTKGKWTIGYGRNLTAKGISESEALMLLESDYKEALVDTKDLFPVSWAQFTIAQHSALVNLVFNMGKAGMQSFKVTLPLLREGKIKQAIENFKVSKWSRDVKKNRTKRVLGLLDNKDYYQSSKVFRDNLEDSE